MQKKLISIVQIFPHFEEKIDFLFQNDESFRELCADHILCTGMLRELKKKFNKHDKEVVEYRDLQQNLEEEILLKILKNCNNF